MDKHITIPRTLVRAPKKVIFDTLLSLTPAGHGLAVGGRPWLPETSSSESVGGGGKYSEGSTFRLPPAGRGPVTRITLRRVDAEAGALVIEHDTPSFQTCDTGVPGTIKIYEFTVTQLGKDSSEHSVELLYKEYQNTGVCSGCPLNPIAWVIVVAFSPCVCLCLTSSLNQMAMAKKGMLDTCVGDTCTAAERAPEAQVMVDVEPPAYASAPINASAPPSACANAPINASAPAAPRPVAAQGPRPFCGQCGAPAGGTPFCSQCGSKI
jgi:hypothetical protein